jgi:hypothetical protein
MIDILIKILYKKIEIEERILEQVYEEEIEEKGDDKIVDSYSRTQHNHDPVRKNPRVFYRNYYFLIC